MSQANAVSAALLVVEDDHSTVDLYVRTLTDFGYRITISTNAEDAFTHASADPYDLAIVDITLPGMSGIDVAKRLRDQWGIYSLFVSARDDKRTVDQAVAAGGLGYLVKPVSPGNLPPAIEAALARALDIKNMSAESAQLKTALESNRAISMAVGALMATRGMTEEEAFGHLRKLARSRREKMEQVARQLIEELRCPPEAN